MLFNSFTFAIFLPIAFLLYYFVPHKYKWGFLLIASYIFYMNLHVGYAVFLLFSTILTYFAARGFEKYREPRIRKRILLFSITLLVTLLLFFKLAMPTIRILNQLIGNGYLAMQPITLRILLPAGMSFYVFQSLGYLIDVYKGKIPAEHHFGYYALFVSFFPQLLAGPIGRADALLPQYKEVHPFCYEKVTYGLKLMAWGYFKKLVVADVFAGTVNAVFDNVQAYSGFIYVIVTVMFAIEIYCDFSGYSDIAIGCAKMFGMDLMTNFKSPYFSCSIKEFWSRWHISLSTWFRDYVYIPLGGNRVGKIRHNLNLLITFLVSGFWHGSSLTYIVWGTLHGIYQILENLICPTQKNTRVDKPAGKGKTPFNIWRLMLTFLLVCTAWVFFRANTLNDALTVFAGMFDGIRNPYAYVKTAVIYLNMPYLSMFGMLLSAFILGVYDYLSLKKDVIIQISKLKAPFRWAIYVLLLLCIALFSEKGIATEFIYFQF